MMIKAFFASKQWLWWAYGGLLFLILSLYAQVHILVLLNGWYGEFYDLLQAASKHTLSEFNTSLAKFMYIVMPYVLIATITNYFTRLYSLRWRESITFNYIPRWRAVHEDIEGSSQRIQEDAYRFAKIVESLGMKAVEAVMKLVAFIPILWQLSKYVDIGFLKSIPGSLVWLALLISIGGMAISWIVGGKLPGLEYNNQKVEAAFRKELVHGEDDKVNYASIAKLTELFAGIKFNYHRLFLHYGYFDIWLNLFSQSLVIIPYVIMGKGLFTGLITLGILIKVANSFDKVRDGLVVFIDNWTTITELRSIHKRLNEFEENLDKFTPK